MNKHHNSFSEEYEVLYNKNGSIKIKEKDEFQTGNEKKIIGLKKCDSEDFQFIENKEFSEEIFNSKIETDKKENEPIPEDY